MRDPAEQAPDDAELERLHTELVAEFARVAVDWAAVEVVARDWWRAPPTGVRQFTMLLEYEAALRVLKALPDGAGAEGFLASMEEQAHERRRGWNNNADRDG